MSSPPLIRRVTGSSATADIDRVTCMPDVGNDNGPETAAIWYPDAFNDMSSGLGDVSLNTYEDDLPSADG